MCEVIEFENGRIRQTKRGNYTVEHNGSQKSGSFASLEGAKAWLEAQRTDDDAA